MSCSCFPFLVCRLGKWCTILEGLSRHELVCWMQTLLTIPNSDTGRKAEGRERFLVTFKGPRFKGPVSTPWHRHVFFKSVQSASGCQPWLAFIFHFTQMSVAHFSWPWQEQFPHNANLQHQFASLSSRFQAWRPIRGDGCSALSNLKRCTGLNGSMSRSVPGPQY